MDEKQVFELLPDKRCGECRAKYEEVLSGLGVRPLKAQAARGIMVKLRGDVAE
jgi:hypothetical protein